MISWVVKGRLEVSRVSETAHLFRDCGWEKLEVASVLTHPDFHMVFDPRIRGCVASTSTFLRVCP